MLSLVIPAYNESSIISDTIKNAVSALSARFDEWELMLVDDGSTDATLCKMREAESEHVRVITYEKNRGKGYAVRLGVLEARGDVVFYTDADLAYGLDVVARGNELLEKTGADIIIGSRKLDREAYNSYPLVRKITSRGFALASRILSGMRYDTQCGIKGFKRTAAVKIFTGCMEERFAFDFEVMMTADKLGFSVCEMPVRIINHRESKVHIVRDSLRMARDVFRIRRRLK